MFQNKTARFFTLPGLLSIFVAAQTQAASPLDGQWSQNCLNGNYQEKIFSENYVQAFDHFFSDKNCQTPLVTFESDGDISLETQNIDFKFSRVITTLHDIQLAEKYNLRQNCGLTQWTVGTPQDTTGLACDHFMLGRNYMSPNSGDMKYGIWKIENGTLYFGQMTRERNANSPETRPIEFNSKGFKKN